MTRRTERGLSKAWMGPSITESGPTMNNTVLALKHGPIKASTKATTSKERSMAKGNSHGSTGPFTRANFCRTISAGRVGTCGQMAALTMAGGRIIKWKASENTDGLMVAYTKATSVQI